MILKNKVIVITGGSKGLGKALAQVLSAEQAKVIISARSAKELKQASLETGALSLVADITKEKEMEKLAAFAIKKYGRLDIWINNAGVWFPQSPIEEIDVKSAHGVFEVNFFGTLYGSRAAMKIMKKQKRGTILNIISRSALRGRPLSAIYASSKWAVRGFTELLREYLEPENVSVLAAYPAGFKSTIFKNKKPAGYDDWMEPAYVAKKIVQNLKREKPKEEMVISKDK